MRGSNEHSGAFIARYSRLMLLADLQITHSKMIGAIRIRLRPEIVKLLSTHRVVDLDSLNVACACIEDGLQAEKAAEKLRRGHTGTSNEDRSSKAYKSGDRKQESKKSQDVKKQTITCHRCNRPGHIRAECLASKNKEGEELKDKALCSPPKRNVNVIATECVDEPEPEVTVGKVKGPADQSAAPSKPNCPTGRRTEPETIRYPIWLFMCHI